MGRKYGKIFKWFWATQPVITIRGVCVAVAACLPACCLLHAYAWPAACAARSSMQQAMRMLHVLLSCSRPCVCCMLLRAAHAWHACTTILHMHAKLPSSMASEPCHVLHAANHALLHAAANSKGMACMWHGCAACMLMQSCSVRGIWGHSMRRMIEAVYCRSHVAALLACLKLTCSQPCALQQTLNWRGWCASSTSRHSHRAPCSTRLRNRSMLTCLAVASHLQSGCRKP